jgi:hypothetical protein
MRWVLRSVRMRDRPSLDHPSDGDELESVEKNEALSSCGASWRRSSRVAAT